MTAVGMFAGRGDVVLAMLMALGRALAVTESNEIQQGFVTL